MNATLYTANERRKTSTEAEVLYDKAIDALDEAIRAAREAVRKNPDSAWPQRVSELLAARRPLGDRFMS